MESDNSLRPIAELKSALSHAKTNFPSLIFYALLMSGVTVVLYFPVISYYGRAFAFFYGAADTLIEDQQAAIVMVRDMTYMLPSFFIYLFVTAAFLMSWVDRHSVEAHRDSRLGTAAIASNGFKAGMKLIAAFGWLGIIVLPAVFLAALIFRLLLGGEDGIPPASAIWALEFLGIFLGLMTFLPVGLSLAAIGRGEKLSAFTAFGRLRGGRLMGVVAMALLFLIPAALRLEAGIRFVDAGWLGESNNTGTLGFLFISTFTESLIFLVWISFSERLLLAGRAGGASQAGAPEEPPSPAPNSSA